MICTQNIFRQEKTLKFINKQVRLLASSKDSVKINRAQCQTNQYSKLKDRQCHTSNIVHSN